MVGTHRSVSHRERLALAYPGVILALWDIDGTLVDTAGHGREAFGEAFAAVFGRDADLATVPMAGRTDHAIALTVLEHAGVERGESHLEPLLAALATALAARRGQIVREGRAMPGTHAALAALAAHPGITQSLLTGNIELNAALKLGAFGLDEHVELDIGGYGSDHGIRSELVRVAREKARSIRGLSVSAAATVLIGDTPLDVAAAHSAGARAIAVATGPYDREALAAAGAETVLEDLSDTDAVIAAVLGGPGSTAQD